MADRMTRDEIANQSVRFIASTDTMSHNRLVREALTLMDERDGQSRIADELDKALTSRHEEVASLRSERDRLTAERDAAQSNYRNFLERSNRAVAKARGGALTEAAAIADGERREGENHPGAGYYEGGAHVARYIRDAILALRARDEKPAPEAVTPTTPGGEP